MTNKQAKRLADMYNTIPKELEIGPWPYKVELTPELIKGEAGNVLGQCHRNEHWIKVAVPGMPSPAAAVGLLLHESLHGIWANADLGQKAKEEDVVLAFEIGLVQLLKHNPDLLKWITKGLK